MPKPPPHFIVSSARWQRGAETAFFGLLLLLGLLVHADYGVSTDEPAHHLNGLINVRYVAELVAPTVAQPAQLAHLPALATHPDHDHGVLFELADSLLGLLAGEDSAAYYRQRHLLVFLVFMAGVWALYRLATRYTRDWRWGLTAAGALVLSPRLFAEAFYNAQDSVFLALFAVAILTLVRLVARPGTGRAVAHGLACATALDVRVGGGLLVLYTLGMVGWRLASDPQKTAWRAWGKYTGIYLLTTAVATVAGWPYLWTDPAGRLPGVLRRMGQFPWQGRNFYLGELLPGAETPWHYVPVWLTITTPWPYLLAGAAGLFAVLAAGFRGAKHFRTHTGQFDLLVLGWLFGPLLLIIGLHSAVYNGWRHLYFIYPALLLLAVRGGQTGHLLARRFRGGRWPGAIVGALLLAGVLHTAYRMVREHPQQQVYFSLLPARVAAEQFDRDYWGLAYRSGLKWVLATDSAARIRVGAAQPEFLRNNLLMLPVAQRNRLVIMPAPYPAGTYLFTNYARYEYGRRLLPTDTLGRKVHELRVNGLPVLGVFRR